MNTLLDVIRPSVRGTFKAACDKGLLFLVSTVLYDRNSGQIYNIYIYIYIIKTIVSHCSFVNDLLLILTINLSNVFISWVLYLKIPSTHLCKVCH